MKTALLRRLVRRIAELEYALIGSCCFAAETSRRDDSAFLRMQVGTSQVHLFDLGTFLRSLGGSSLSYSDCKLGNVETPERAWARLERDSERALQRHLPHELRLLMSANLVEHRELVRHHNLEPSPAPPELGP